MKKLVLAAALVAGLSAPVLAGGMDNAIGNTVRVSAGSESFDAWFYDDGRYADSRGISGSWSYEGQLCIHVATEEGTQSNCGPWNEGLAPGDSWSTDGWSSDGAAITVQIIAAN